ncbi:MAG: dioxygenase [Magnetococcales bacterium]|nr:dioxygenase [Magnetococcales bacterium]
MKRDESGGKGVDPLFVSHGAPDLILRDHPCRQFLENLGHDQPRPRGVVVVSGHWERPEPTLTGVGPLETIHDFFGFPRELYAMRYPASGESWLVEAVTRALESGNRSFGQASGRGLDHGAWVPLKLMYPEADIPVVQLSLLERADPVAHLEMGRALHPLGEKGVLILGSGAVTHNLRRLNQPGTPPEPWSVRFSEWLHQGLTGDHPAALASELERAPHADLAHPTMEHLLPLFVALGAAGSSPAAKRLHNSYDYGSLNLSAYRFCATDR